MSNILITGTKGFIGQNLKDILIQNHNIIEINEDIFDFTDWDKKILYILNYNKPNVIYHVGACSDTLEHNVNYMMKLNFESTKLLVDWSMKNSSKIIYSSSAANYGVNNSFPSNLYGWSKYVSEQYVISSNGIALRYFNVYGPKENHKKRMASVAYNSYSKFKNGNIVKLFPKKPMRDFVYVKDVIEANLHASINYDKLNRNYYDVGFGESRTFEDVLNILGIPYEYYEESEIPVGYQFYTCSNKNKWMEGWTPKYNLEDGLIDYKSYLELSI